MSKFKINTERVEGWLAEKVDEKSLAIIFRTLEAFEDLGPLSRNEGLPRSRIKHLFDGIHEIRVHQFRVAYFWDGDTCVLLHGIRKKRDDWPKQDIQNLKKRKRDYLAS